MDAFDIAKLTKKEILEDENIKALYIKSYKAFFNEIPNCIKCTFNKDFNKFKRFLQGKTEAEIITLKENKMNSFKLKKGYNLKIFSYKKDGKIFRRYGKDLTDDFVAELIKSNPKNKDFFEELPKSKSKPAKKKTATKKVEKKPVAKEVKENEQTEEKHTE